MKHSFTGAIMEILASRYGDAAESIYAASPLLQYINIKTRSADRGSKARGSFANHYALYVLVEDYLKNGFAGPNRGQYQKYEGARFTDLFRRQRELPFGAKLQNHAINSRLNDEFVKYFPTLELRPILRDQKEQRYWVNERLLVVAVPAGDSAHEHNIAKSIIEIIDRYVAAKKTAFESFIETCKQLADLAPDDSGTAVRFVEGQLQPAVDARVFEIVSFAILKAHYGEQSIFWGWAEDEKQEDPLSLYKTGRTNANDGGIDFVMKPIGRFFQVTETIDVNKYFLDIDKVHRFPLTFVVKSGFTETEIKLELRREAHRKYGVDSVVQRYMECVEEIINIRKLLDVFGSLVRSGKLRAVMDEIVLQSRVEFNLDHLESE
ncbi:MAG: hypothetical protein WD468_01165 [Pirellulales bacterium]